MLSQSTGANLYAADTNLVAMSPAAITTVGGSQAHLNMQPFLTLSFCIALQGIFPSPELRRPAMAQPYVGEIRMFAGNFAPAGWMFCEGQLLPISENETLFQLIGTTYGGDGESTFALPDLRGRIPIHQGNGFILAETGGAEEITLTVNQIPAHSHPLLATSNCGSRHFAVNNVVLATAPLATQTPTARTTRQTNLSPPGSQLRWAARSRTPTSSPICASTSSSRCSGSSRPRPRDGGSGQTQHTRRSMADPFVAEIRIFPFNFAPRGWAWCDGQLLPLRQNTALFSLLGTTYGGDGKSNFALPDLQGRAPMHPGQGPGSRCTTWARPAARRRSPCSNPRSRPTAMPSGHPPPTASASRQSARCSAHGGINISQYAAPGACVAESQRARPGGRRPAAQQPAAVPDVLLLHRAAGRVPAAG